MGRTIGLLTGPFEYQWPWVSLSRAEPVEKIIQLCRLGPWQIHGFKNKWTLNNSLVNGPLLLLCPPAALLNFNPFHRTPNLLCSHPPCTCTDTYSLQTSLRWDSIHLCIFTLPLGTVAVSFPCPLQPKNIQGTSFYSRAIYSWLRFFLSP